MKSEFWIVVSDATGAAAHPFRHYNEEAAFAESQRLARLHAGRFFVMKAIGASEKNDVRTVRYDGYQEIPF